MQREKRDLYYKNGQPSGKTYFKGDEIPHGLYPMVVMIAIQNSDGKFLMQKRVAQKGGDWGVTGGHPKAGETTDQGIITEVREELGIVQTNHSKHSAGVVMEKIAIRCIIQNLTLMLKS